MSEEQALIFISYARSDRDRVERYYATLQSQGLRMWMDVHDIRAGQNWEFEITKALDKSSIIIVFISYNSVDRRGYLQKEIRVAIDHYKEKLIDDIYIIPVMLDELDIPHQFRSIQALFEKDGDIIAKLQAAIDSQIDRLDNVVVGKQQNGGLSWNFSRYNDSWEGLPGYDISYQYIKFYSSEHKNIDEITNIIRGDLAGMAMSERNIMLQQDGNNLMNFGKPRYWRTNTFDATCTGVAIVENVVSIEYTIYWYGAGAAHGISSTKTFVFIIHPTIYLGDFKNLFRDPDEALSIVQSSVRDKLGRLEFGEDDGNEKIKLQEEWIKNGTSGWEHMSAFAFVEDGLTITFAPYQVAAYAFGSQRATLSWREIRPLLKNYILCALHREFEHFDEKSEVEKAAMRGATADNNP